MSQQDILLKDKPIVPTLIDLKTSKSNEDSLLTNEEIDLNALNMVKSTGEAVPMVSRPAMNLTETLFNQIRDSSPTDSKTKFRRINFVDSDDELDKSDKLNEQSKDIEESINETVEQNKFKLYDSDCEDVEKPIVMENGEHSDDNEDKIQIKKKQKKFVMDSESEDELFNKTDTVVADIAGQENQSSIPSLSNLCDSESSDGEYQEDDKLQSPQRVQAQNFKSGRSTINEKVLKPKKMTAKDAIKQRKEIQSESQRMLRETPVSLPYHKPKERSIKEFLSSRPRLSVIKGDHDIPASAAIKMTTERLQLVTQKMEEREKELQNFYKSESESEEEICTDEKQIVTECFEGVTTQEETVTELKTGDNNESELPLSDLNESDEVVHNVNILTNHVVEDNVDNDSTNKDDKDNAINENQFEEICADRESIENDKSPILEIQENPSLFVEDEENSESILENTTENDSSKQNKIIIHSIVSIPKESIYTLEESMDFDFNLDGIEELPELKGIEQGNDRHNFLKSDDENAHTDMPSASKQDLLKQLRNFTPCLSGDSDHEIDLDEGVIKPNAIIQLMERFKKHVEVKHVPKSKIKLDIVNVSGGEIHNQTVLVSVDDKEEPLDTTDKPGLRIQKLRSKLQEQIAQQRTELWKHKQQAFEEITKTDDEKLDGKSDYEENILDIDAEEEFTDGDVTDEENDDSSDFKEETNSNKLKSAFIDDEAEDSNHTEETERNDGVTENVDIVYDSDSIAQDGNNSTASELIHKDKPDKSLKRILKAFTEDSDEDDLVPLAVDIENISTASTRSFDDEDDDISIPPYQQRPDKTPRREMTQSKSDITFHTPITQLSGLQGLNSGSKFLHESPTSPFPFPLPSPVNTPTAKQKLFADSSDFQTETNTQELIGLCSGEFSNTNVEECDVLKKPELCTQDFLSICSGSFAGLTNESTGYDINHSLINKDNVQTEDNNDETITDFIPHTNSNSQSKYLDEDRLISQLLDEEELEKFKKKFESPISTTIYTSSINNSNSEIKGGGRLVFDSDDENTESNPKIKQNKHKKLTFSDDESAYEEEEESENYEEIDLSDDEFSDDDTNREIGYDSEENEIEVPKELYKPSEFFEKEAELSESDWDSADEDERDLDQLEKEQGDDEVFDEDKIRNDLEKIHMRNVLDQDNREIKILQELLLEDGELHGTGRQRQFRWKNIDDNANDDNGPVNGDEVYLDEDESEEQWRRVRHQREMFLKSQQDKLDDDNINCILSDSNSQVVRIGQEVLQRSLSKTSTHSDKDKTIPSTSETFKSSSTLMNARGSFLARSDNFLTRLAGITKVNNTTTVIKTSTKIVFQTSTSLDDENLESNKRKADDGTPTVIKKLRLSSNISPSLKGVERKKKLF